MRFLANAKITPMSWQIVYWMFLTKGGHSRTLQVLKTSSPQDEGQTRTLDMAKEIEITGTEPVGQLDSVSQDRLIALEALANLVLQL